MFTLDYSEAVMRGEKSVIFRHREGNCCRKIDHYFKPHLFFYKQQEV